MKNENSHDHNHGEVKTSTEVVEPAVLENTVERYIHEEHSHSGLDGLLEVMFGFEHVVAEFFWNAVFILATFLITKAVALRKIHKYVDDKHGVKHKKEDY
jgi:hypothetical protein